MTALASDRPIALALSGGGVRAMVFHLGVLRGLADRGDLERVSHISSVSGGSLVAGLVLQANNLSWPSSEQFLTTTLPSIKQLLCARSLERDTVRQLANPLNWRFLLSRANLLGIALEKLWGIKALLRDLPVAPEWSINGTTAENGKRFRFKKENMGDYLNGYTLDNGDFPLAQALAVSAAFPGVFGPLALPASRFTWTKRSWNAPLSNTEERALPFGKLHLYDGGVYDNLGLEPFFDAGRSTSKIGEVSILVSDAGAPLPQGFRLGPLNLFRLKRVADIMSDQSRALRVRTFATYALAVKGRGQLIFIGTPGRTLEEDKDAAFTRSFPTRLMRITSEQFDRIAAHGHRLSLRPEAAVDI